LGGRARWNDERGRRDGWRDDRLWCGVQARQHHDEANQQQHDHRATSEE
jgi:hypothetical protein